MGYKSGFYWAIQVRKFDGSPIVGGSPIIVWVDAYEGEIDSISDPSQNNVYDPSWFRIVGAVSSEIVAL